MWKELTFVKLVFACSLLALFGNACDAPTSYIQKQDSEEFSEWIDYDGISRKSFRVQHEERTYKYLVYKIDRSQFIAQIHHQTDSPKRLSEWHDQLSPQITINGAFFTEDLMPTGRLVIDGIEQGIHEYTTETSGAFTSSENQMKLVGSEASIQPINDPNTDLVQSFPLLITNGINLITEDTEKIARRTILAENSNNELLIIIVDQTPVSLYQIARILESSDLDIQIALNLDGGPSTGIVLETQGFSESILPLTPLPQVISFSKQSQD